MKKPRSDSKLLRLPDDQQAQLAEWLLSGVPYHQAREMVAKEFGVQVRSLNTFSRFWEQVCAPLLLLKRQRAVQTADAVAEEASKNPGRFDQATIDALKQRAFEQAISPGANPRDVKAIFSLVLKARDQEQAQQQLDLDRHKFARETCELFLRWYADRRAREIATGPETNAAKIERLGQLMFGEDWQ
ncbi:MAG TPA: hypothetical protein VNO52_15860 [Methylomirabilota bacterium]|nr:hypothetical protein [Methylomirabilota bacterium]